jgi:Fe-S-cluster-containing dehydrogenase component
MKYIEFHVEKCIACDLCSGVCSLSKLGRVQPAGACIRIARDPATYLGAMQCSVCDMTHDRVCVDSCPQDALVWDEAAGVVRFVQEECTDCGSCLDACSNVHQDAVDRRIMICDLCGGDPLCVQWCPEGALTWGGAS